MYLFVGVGFGCYVGVDFLSFLGFFEGKVKVVMYMSVKIGFI